MLGLKQLHLIS